MAQQTAINWLRGKLEEAYDKEKNLPATYTFALLNAAEQIEKEQIIKAVYDSMGTNFDPNMGRAELYYEENYTSIP